MASSTLRHNYYPIGEIEIETWWSPETETWKACIVDGSGEVSQSNRETVAIVKQLIIYIDDHYIEGAIETADGRTSSDG